MNQYRDSSNDSVAMCTRVLQLEEADGSTSEVTVSIAAPGVDATGAYCAVSISGKALNERFDVRGIDGFQALQIAFAGIRAKLDQFPGEKIWLNQRGFTGFPRIISDGFGLEFLNRCEHLIDVEYQKLQDGLTARRLKSEEII